MIQVTLDDEDTAPTGAPSPVTEQGIIQTVQALRGVSAVTKMVFRPDAQGGMWVPADAELHATR